MNPEHLCYEFMLEKVNITAMKGESWCEEFIRQLVFFSLPCYSAQKVVLVVGKLHFSISCANIQARLKGALEYAIRAISYVFA